MAQFSRSFWWVIAVGLLLSAIAIVVASNVDTARFANYVAIAAVLVNLCGFVLLSEQLGATKEATENQTRWEIEQVSFNVYKMLVDQPSLRPYSTCSIRCSGSEFGRRLPRRSGANRKRFDL